MAELNIEYTLNKTDSEGYKCTKEINKTITIDLLKTGYTFGEITEDAIPVIPDDDSIFNPFWSFLDKDRYEIQIRQNLFHRKNHRVSLSIDVYDKEAGSCLYYTAESPVLTKEEYNYFYNRLKTEFPDVKNWLSLEGYLKDDMGRYISEQSADEYFDSETGHLIAEAIIKYKTDKVLIPNLADFNTESIAKTVNDVIKESLRLLLKQDKA